MKKIPNPPRAAKKPVKLEKFGDVRIDPYYWLRERENPGVKAYLEAENRYFEAVTEDIKDFEENLFKELKARMKDADETVPYKYKNWYYQIKYPAGKEYPQYLRWKKEDQKEIFFDANERAKGHAYYHVTGLKISPDDRYLAFNKDTRGRRLYTLRFKDLKTGKILDEAIPGVSGSVAWANDSQTLFYVKKHPETLRSYRLYKHKLGTSPEKDELVYEETDEEYDIFVSKSKTEAYIFLNISANSTTEYRLLPADNPGGKFITFYPRLKGTEYYPYHLKDDKFFVVSNENGAENYMIYSVRWFTRQVEKKIIIPHRKDTLIEELEVFNNWMAITERKNGLTKIRIFSQEQNLDYYIDFPEETYTAYLSINAEMDSDVLRYVYNSLTTPASVMEWNIHTRKQVILKEDEVAGGTFDKSNYESVRSWAPGRDGTQIPVSLVWRKGMQKNGKNPLLLYGYGAYGITVDDNFSKNRLSLLDRGFIFAIAHVRGGEYLGRRWYEEGKLLKKKNTFYDFIDVAKFLINQKFTSPEHLYAMGGSAGGLLIGAVMNMEPGLFHGMVAQVPFVDVLTTMLDESIPLTTGEYDEWGNPNEEEYYWYIKSYSPYDNVEAKNYPNLLITTGLHDSQVQYWEPAKWTAKLRDLKTGDNILLLHTDMTTGHSGASGRFQSLKDTARDFAFLLDLAGKTPNSQKPKK